MLIYYPFGVREVKLITQAFKNSAVILYPTDTLPALGCLLDDEQAVLKIKRLKNRLPEKPLLMVAGDWSRLSPWANRLEPVTIKAFNKLQRAPLSIAVPSDHKALAWLNPGGQSLAFRITKQPCVAALLKISRKPMVATSANISGQRSASQIADLDTAITKRVDLVVRYAKTVSKNHLKSAPLTMPSTLVQYNPPKSLSIIRPGAYTADHLKADLPSDWKLS